MTPTTFAVPPTHVHAPETDDGTNLDRNTPAAIVRIWNVDDAKFSRPADQTLQVIHDQGRFQLSGYSIRPRCTFGSVDECFGAEPRLHVVESGTHVEIELCDGGAAAVGVTLASTGPATVDIGDAWGHMVPLTSGGPWRWAPECFDQFVDDPEYDRFTFRFATPSLLHTTARNDAGTFTVTRFGSLWRYFRQGQEATIFTARDVEEGLRIAEAAARNVLEIPYAAVTIESIRGVAERIAS